jgi:hypothetical protein
MGTPEAPVSPKNYSILWLPCNYCGVLAPTLATAKTFGPRIKLQLRVIAFEVLYFSVLEVDIRALFILQVGVSSL